MSIYASALPGLRHYVILSCLHLIVTPGPRLRRFPAVSGLVVPFPSITDANRRFWNECSRPRATTPAATADPGRGVPRGPGGIAWRQLTAGFPPATTVYDVFRGWSPTAPGSASTTRCADQVRIRAGRASLLTAAVIDAQSVRGADTVPGRSRGYAAGKKINGRKRHIAVNNQRPAARGRGHRGRHP